MNNAKKILLVEDDQDIATLLRLNLQDEGYQIVHEADGTRALHQLEQSVWDAVILDLMLPGVDGLEICRRIRQMTRYLPVIIISARTSETPVAKPPETPSTLAFFASSVTSRKRGSAVTARIPRITITITSSMREKPVARLIIPFPGIVGAIGFIVMLPPSCPALFHAGPKKSCSRVI